MMKRCVKKIWRFVVVIAGSGLLLIGISAIYTRIQYSHDATEPKDCAVIFGAAVWRDDIPSQALYDRTRTAAALYHDGLVDCIILSGGASTYGAHEVTVMQNILLEERVPNNILTLDRDGRNTHATIVHIDPTYSYIFVSNDFHLGRIALLAKRATITDFALQRATYYNGRYGREPYFFTREVFATLYYFFALDRLDITLPFMSR